MYIFSILFDKGNYFYLFYNATIITFNIFLIIMYTLIFTINILHYSIHKYTITDLYNIK